MEFAVEITILNWELLCINSTRQETRKHDISLFGETKSYGKQSQAGKSKTLISGSIKLMVFF